MFYLRNVQCFVKQAYAFEHNHFLTNLEKMIIDGLKVQIGILMPSQKESPADLNPKFLNPEFNSPSRVKLSVSSAERKLSQN